MAVNSTTLIERIIVACMCKRYAVLFVCSKKRAKLYNTRMPCMTILHQKTRSTRASGAAQLSTRKASRHQVGHNAIQLCAMQLKWHHYNAI